jgi:tRNA(fMet)-specific endonuclease VapC
MKYLLDTDTCIALLRGHEQAVERAKKVVPDDLAISSITRYELRYGALRCSGKRRGQESRKVTLFLDVLHEIPFTEDTAEGAAEIRCALESLGHGIGPMDTLIAATAIEAGLTLVTGNLREFSRVKGLPLENWIA